MNNAVKTYKEFCPVMWYQGMEGDGQMNICAYSDKSDPRPARSESDFDIIYQCFEEACPTSFQRWPLIMSNSMDSQNCDDDGIYLSHAFDKGTCFTASSPGDRPDPQHAPQPHMSPTIHGKPPSYMSDQGFSGTSWQTIFIAIAVIGGIMIVTIFLVHHLNSSSRYTDY